MDGIINVYKEKGYSSHDVVARLRGITKEKHIGHTGTLDPAATGVLPVCLGWATKVCELLTDRSKVYETVLLLGIKTDSEDVTGTITGIGNVNELKDEEIIAAINGFVGEIEQVPPMLSAKRIQGVRLYDLARQGIETERKAKKVKINSIEIISDIVRGKLSDTCKFEPYDSSMLKKYKDNLGDEDGHWHWENDGIYTQTESDTEVIRIALRITCEKGTYIRTICNDIGNTLGCFGCMERLLRTGVGEFTIENTYRLEELESIFKSYRENGNNEEIGKILLSPDKCFMNIPEFNVKEKYDSVIHNGNYLRFRHFREYIANPDPTIRVYDSTGHFCAVYEWSDERNVYKPLKMFC